MNNIDSLILYEDKDIYVCHKPAGMLSQSDRGFSVDMVSALLTKERKAGNSSPFIAPVNRLDRPVEGLILFARSSNAASKLTGQFTGKGMDKCYYAVVTGTPDESGWVCLEDYIIKDAKSNTSRVAEPGAPQAKAAKLEYKVINRKDVRSLLQVKLYTGRHHQIRVQLASAGLPILGDNKYGDARANDAFAGGGLALCSFHMEFCHPRTGELMCFDTKPEGEAFADFFTS